MEDHQTAKEAIWEEIHLLMAKQLTDGPLSAEEMRQMDRLAEALNILGAPEADGKSGALLDAFRQLSLLRLEQEAGRKELRRIALLLERHSRRRRRVRIGVGAAAGLAGLGLGLSLLLLLVFQWLDAFSVRILCTGSVAGLGLVIFLVQKRLAWGRMACLDGEDAEDEEEDWGL